MNVYKLRGCVFLSLLSILTCSASEPTGTLEQLPVFPMSDDRIDQHRILITQGERKRHLVRVFGAYVAITGTTVALSNWLFSPVDKPASEDDLSDLEDRVGKIEKGAHKKKKPTHKHKKSSHKKSNHEDKEVSWSDWCSSKVKKVWGFFYRMAPGIAVSMTRTYVMKQAGKLIWPIVPSFGQYVATTPSLVWAMTRYSKFYDSVAPLTNWTRSMLNEMDKPMAQNELALCGNQFVVEMEKILGYMGFILDRLKEGTEDKLEHGQAIYLRRGESCMKAIAFDVQRLVATINQFALLGDDYKQKIRPMIETMHKILFSIVCQLENFEPVTREAGYAEEFERDIFGPLKGYVMPRWMTISPRPEDPDDEESEWLKDLVMDAINDAI